MKNCSNDEEEKAKCPGVPGASGKKPNKSLGVVENKMVSESGTK